MKIRPTVAALGAAVLGVAVVSGAALADEGTVTVRPDRAGAGRLFRVDQTFSREIDGSCRYDARVHGTVRELITDGRGTAQSPRYLPRLNVDARLTCSEGTGSHRSREVTPTPDYSRAQLEHELALRARVLSSRNGEVCTYRPDLSFRDGRLALDRVRGGCAMPRGGGPYDGRLPVRRRGEATSGHSFRMVTRDGHDVIEYVDYGAHGSLGR